MADLRLENLPTEILGTVALYLHGLVIKQLKLCGCKLLWEKLCNIRGVKLVNLAGKFCKLQSYPGWLNELQGVEELSFQCNDELVCNNVGFRITNMPKTLRKLKLKKMPSTSQLFFGGIDATGSNVSFFLPSLEVIHLGLDWTELEPWMSGFPASLKILVLDLWNAAIPLPESLESFTCDKVNASSVTSLLLPPHLTALEAGSIGLPASPLSFAPPPSLTRFAIQRFAGRSISVEELAQFPQGLQNLTFSLLDQISSSLPVSSLASAFPSYLHTLKVSGLPPSYWHALPRSLTSYTQHSLFREIIMKSSMTEPIYQAAWAALPPNLIELRLEIRELTELPLELPVLSHLTSLELPDCYFSHEALPKLQNVLPPCLTALEIPNADGVVVKALPRAIRSLTVHHVAISPSFLQNLPPALTLLTAQYGHGRESVYDVRTQQYEYFHLNGEVSMPAGDEPLWDVSAGICFPPSITHLDWKGFPSLDAEFVRLLPKNLTFLSITSTFLPTFCDSDLEPLSTLPLVTFHLISRTTLTSACFAFLPRVLQKFTIFSSQVLDEHILDLPRNITSLDLPHATSLTRACLPALPPHLTRFYASANSNIDAVDLPLFPRNYQPHSLARGIFVNAKFSVTG